MIMFLVGTAIAFVAAVIWLSIFLILSENLFSSDNQDSSDKRKSLTTSLIIATLVTVSLISAITITEVGQESYSTLKYNASNGINKDVIQQYAEDGKITRFEYFVIIATDKYRAMKDLDNQKEEDIKQEKSDLLNAVKSVEKNDQK